MPLRPLWLALIAAAALWALPASPARAQDAESLAWSQARTCEDLRSYLAAYPAGRYAREARAALSTRGCPDPEAEAQRRAAMESASERARLENEMRELRSQMARERSAAEMQERMAIERARMEAERRRDAQRSNVGASARRIMTPVIVEVDRTQARAPANGGSAVLLLSDSEAARPLNLATCESVWSLMGLATAQEVRVGLRRAADGALEALRPLYWLNRTPAEAQTCASRLAAYDYTRAKVIRDKYGIATPGPHFLVARADEQAAALIDLTGRSTGEIDDMVRYFRDGFAFQADIWDASRNEPARRRSLLAGFFGDRFQESMANAIGLITNPRARAGCQLGDLRDAPCT
jgi:hypothetical protein